MTKHGAKFSPEIMDEIVEFLLDEWDEGQLDFKILDPFAGVGTIHDLKKLSFFNISTYAVEIEPEWAKESLSKGPTLNMDFLKADLRYYGAPYDLVITSPCYGNRLADHHNAQDGSTRNGYKFWLNRMPTEGSSAIMQWGDEYKAFHRKAWAKVYMALKPGGLFILNISDHYRRKELQPVSEWHRDACYNLGFGLRERIKVQTKRLRYGANRQRPDHENLFVFVR